MIAIFKRIVDSIAKLFKGCYRWPSNREALDLLALTSMGLFGNHLNSELFFGVNFIFGSIATMIAIWSSGSIWGTLVGIVIGSYTYVLWGHPYGIMIFGLEAFVVGFITCCLKKDNMILIDVGYWFLIGLPLFWVFHSYQLGLSEPVVNLIVLQQMVNGITSVALASLLIQFTPIIRWVSVSRYTGMENKMSMRSTISTLLAIFILLPMLGVIIISGQDEFEETLDNLEDMVKNEVEDTRRELSSTLHFYSAALASTASVELNRDNRESWESTINNLGKNLIPGLLNTEILSADGEILFSYPKQRSGISEYANHISSVTAGSHYLSSVHVDGNVEGPYFTMIEPISEGNVLATSFSTKIFGDRLIEISHGKQHIELIDDQGYIVASSGIKDLSGFYPGKNPHHLLPLNEELHAMVRWRQAYWEDTTEFMGDNGWTIRVAAPMEKSIELLRDDYIQRFLTMLIMFVAALFFVPLLSRSLSSPLKRLTLAADMFTLSIKRTDVIFPKSNIKEIKSLVEQLQKFVQTINKKQLELSRSEAESSGIAKDLMQLIDTANAPIFGVDLEGRVNEWNQQAEKITGFSKTEVMGRGLVAHFITDDYKNSVGEVLKKALKGKETANYEFQLFTKSGDQVAVLLNSTARCDLNGNVVGVIGVGQDITEQKKSAELIWQQAHFDTLTGLPNRRMFYDRLEQEMKKSDRSGLPMVLMLLDLDRFKEVNDTLGHVQGDVLLVEAARRIAECVRETDTVARLGGDEFTVILSEMEDINTIETIAQNIIECLAAPFQLLQETGFVSGSLGISLYPNYAQNINALITNADQAMYLAKNLGRNRFSYFTPVLQEASETRMRMLSDLRNALPGKQLVVYYQPIVEISTGKIYKAEALLRWKHPENGIISPALFIPLAEESGLIHEIGDWVFYEIARDLARWRKMFVPEFKISVNVSPVQFRQDGVDNVSSWIRHSRAMDLPGESLVIEITEGLLLNTEINVTEKLLSFRNAGIQISVDDFGTGYSSLAYLKRFDIDYLKIDQAFVHNLEDDPDDKALCEAIITMGHKLGLKVIAEGVETEQQRDLLVAFGCDYAQGWLYSKAIPAEELEVLLKE